MAPTSQKCPANASPVCGEGICACACNAGFYRSIVGTCVPNTNCPPPNVLTQAGEYSVCTCANGFISDGAGGCVCPAGYVQSPTTGQCVLPPSGRARARHRRGLANKPHGRRGQQVFAPATSEGLVTKAHCPDGETACPLPSGAFYSRAWRIARKAEPGSASEQVGLSASTPPTALRHAVAASVLAVPARTALPFLARFTSSALRRSAALVRTISCRCRGEPAPVY